MTFDVWLVTFWFPLFFLWKMVTIVFFLKEFSHNVCNSKICLKKVFFWRYIFWKYELKISWGDWTLLGRLRPFPYRRITMRLAERKSGGKRARLETSLRRRIYEYGRRAKSNNWPSIDTRLCLPPLCTLLPLRCFGRLTRALESWEGGGLTVV